MDKSGFIVGIEAGGTSFLLGLAAIKDIHNIVISKRIETVSPEETLGQCKKIIELWGKSHNILAIGVAAFGPIDLTEGSEFYGYITTTPKEQWKFTNILGFFEKSFPSMVCTMHTDVYPPALAESKETFESPSISTAYVTVGTGIGASVCFEDESTIFCEAGHASCPVSRVDQLTGFPGVCSFHKCGCIEGMACASSIAKRAGIDPSELKSLPDDHDVWNNVAHYLAHLCLNITLMWRPKRIVLGGGVMQRSCLFKLIRMKFVKYLNDYVSVPPVDKYIVPPKLSHPGLIGAFYLASRGLKKL
ncbi:ROK family like protein [Aduncisulcus paluster]|uniref:fructokinase n=1 Tax=Aduncisulcus paluster TaxID=2918883 RepID=A0ABQ5KSD2_9EUKA|nr:ROK family like protein [Aduncisulcus paluster]